MYLLDTYGSFCEILSRTIKKRKRKTKSNQLQSDNNRNDSKRFDALDQYKLIESTLTVLYDLIHHKHN